MQMSMGVIVGLPSSSRQRLGQQQQQQCRSDAAVSARVSTALRRRCGCCSGPRPGPLEAWGWVGWLWRAAAPVWMQRPPGCCCRGGLPPCRSAGASCVALALVPSG